MLVWNSTCCIFFHFMFVKFNLLLRHVETVARFGVVFLLFALDLESSTTKADLIHISPSNYAYEKAMLIFHTTECVATSNNNNNNKMCYWEFVWPTLIRHNSVLTDEPVEFEKQLIELQDFMKKTHHLQGIRGTYHRRPPIHSSHVPECNFHVGYKWIVMNLSMTSDTF